MLLNEQKCQKCGKEVGIGDSSWCDKCNKFHCDKCGCEKETKLWFIMYYNAENKQVGPTWAAASKIKPTRWANQAFAGAGYTYKIKQATDSEREKYIEENGFLG